MKQGIDPITHKQLKENQVTRDEENSANKTSMLQIPPHEQFTESKHVFDLLFVHELQSNENPSEYNSEVLTQYHDHHSEFENNPNYVFCSASSVTKLEHGHMTEIDFGSSSTSRMSSSNSSNMCSNQNTAGIRMSGNSEALSWDVENKMESLFQYPYIGVKTEELKSSPSQERDQFYGNSTAGDFMSNYPLSSLTEELSGANLDVFQQI